MAKPRPGEDGYAAVVETTAKFVQQWNDWSTAEDRQDVYKRAWETTRRGRSALAFIRAVADEKGVPVPDHIQLYLTKHRAFSDTFQRAFKKVRKHNWRLGAVVDQTNLLPEFSPEVSLLKNRETRLVMLYVVGDESV